MTESQRQHIEKQLQEIQAWRSSGLPLVKYVEQLGQSLADWRGKLSWEGRWRNLLQGKSLPYTTHPKPAHAFVKAMAPALPSSTPNLSAVPHIRVTLQSKTGGALLAHIDWPSDQTQQCGQWLREVLA